MTEERKAAIAATLAFMASWAPAQDIEEDAE